MPPEHHIVFSAETSIKKMISVSCQTDIEFSNFGEFISDQVDNRLSTLTRQRNALISKIQNIEEEKNKLNVEINALKKRLDDFESRTPGINILEIQRMIKAATPKSVSSDLSYSSAVISNCEKKIDSSPQTIRSVKPNVPTTIALVGDCSIRGFTQELQRQLPSSYSVKGHIISGKHSPEQFLQFTKCVIQGLKMHDYIVLKPGLSFFSGGDDFRNFNILKSILTEFPSINSLICNFSDRYILKRRIKHAIFHYNNKLHKFCQNICNISIVDLFNFSGFNFNFGGYLNWRGKVEFLNIIKKICFLNK